MISIFERPSFIGIEIGYRSIKLVELEKNKKQHKLSKVGEMPIPAGILMSENKDDLEIISKSIKDLVKMLGCKTTDVACAISSGEIFAASIDLPLMTAAEVEYAMKWEIKKRIPGKIEDTHAKWIVTNQREKTEVLIVAIPKRIIKRYLEVISNSGLIPGILEIEPFSLARSLTQPGQGSIINIHVGSSLTTVNFIQDGALRISRYIKAGEEQIIESMISFSKSISPTKVAIVNKYTVKKNESEQNINYRQNPILREIIDEFKKLCHFSMENGKEISQVVLSGECALIPNFPEYLGNALEKEISIANTWLKIDCSSHESPAQLKKISPRFAVAAGLALA